MQSSCQYTLRAEDSNKLENSTAEISFRRLPTEEAPLWRMLCRIHRNSRTLQCHPAIEMYWASGQKSSVGSNRWQNEKMPKQMQKKCAMIGACRPSYCTAPDGITWEMPTYQEIRSREKLGGQCGTCKGRCSACEWLLWVIVY